MAGTVRLISAAQASSTHTSSRAIHSPQARASTAPPSSNRAMPPCWWRRDFARTSTTRTIFSWSVYDISSPSPCPLPLRGRGEDRGSDHSGDHSGQPGLDHPRHGALDGAVRDVALHQGEEGL